VRRFSAAFFLSFLLFRKTKAASSPTNPVVALQTKEGKKNGGKALHSKGGKTFRSTPCCGGRKSK